MKILSLAAFLFAISTSADSFAQTLQFYMPKDGGQFIELGYSRNSTEAAQVNGAQKIDTIETNISLRFEKAMSPFWAIGLDYVTTNGDREFEDFDPVASFDDPRKGPQDLELYAYGLVALQAYWKFTYYHPLEQAKEDNNNNQLDVDDNYSTGGHFGITLGYLIAPTTGIRIDYTPSYSYQIDDEVEAKDERKVGSQTKVAFFKEFLSEGSLYGFEVSHLSISKGEFTNDDDPAGGAVNTFDEESREAVQARVYPAWSFGALQVITNLSITNYINIDTVFQNELELGIDFRYNF